MVTGSFSDYDVENIRRRAFTMSKDTETMKHNAEVAQFRFALIAPVIQGLYPDASATAYYKRVTASPLTLPDGSTVTYSYKTLEKWKSQYSIGGLDALMPGTRSDKGIPRALNEDAIAEIYRIKEEHPRMNATQIYTHLVRESFIPATVSVDSVQRFIRHNDLKSARDPNLRDRKAFEEDEFGKIWQADTCYLPHITEDGTSRRVYCIMIIDDHSRLLVGGELFYTDNACNFQKVLKDAIATYGIPDKLYVDNGCSYSNAQLSMICVSLGILLLHTRVRDGATSLSQFNGMLKDYMRDYNTTFHRGIDTIPLERYQASKDHPRQPESRQWLDDCFYNRITRKVRKDSTISIDRVCYDVPMQFISAKVDVRYLPDDMTSAYILFDGEKFPIRQTSRNDNCHTRRNNPPAIDYSKAGGES